MSRKTKLEKALAPMLPNDRIRFADMAYGIQCHADRLSKLHEALVAAVEALEQIETTYDGFQIHGELSREALYKIDKVLEEK